MEEDWESWAMLIRSTLVSSKNPLTPRELNRDIKEIDGRNIPYRQMNYSSLEEMLKDISGLKIFQKNGEIVIQAIANEKTSHIQKMVQHQKKPKKKRTHPYAPNTFYVNEQPITNQTPENSRNVINVPINGLSNQVNSHEISSQSSFEPKVTSTPTPVLRQPEQIPQQHQQHQQQPSSYTKDVQFASKPNLQQTLTPSECPLSGLSNRGSDIVLDRVSQHLSSTSQGLIVKVTSQGRRVISYPIEVDPRIVLNNYCEIRKLPRPVYKDSSLNMKSFYSYVEVLKKYSSYPQEAKSKVEAEKLAAEVALRELAKDNKKSTVITSDEALIVKRIVDIVNAHPRGGLFESRVVELYTEQYNESLPSGWLKLVEHLIDVDVLASNFTILRPVNYNTEIKTQSVTLLEPENLKLSDMEEFWLQVYNVNSTTSISGLIIDENHSNKVNKLAQEMKEHYAKEESNALLVDLGKHYAVFDSEWHRVRCLKLDEASKTARVFFIDRGDEDVFPLSRLRVLHSKFCILPAQAVQLSLADLEIFEDCEKSCTLLEQLLLNTCVFARIIRNRKRLEIARRTSVLSAELFLKRDGEEVNLNHFISSEILNKIANPLAFLTPEKVAQEVHISYVDKNAIFIQLKLQGMKLLKALISKLLTQHLKPILNFDYSKMYIAHIQGEWQRVRVVNIENENTAQVLCVDVGNTLTVKRNNLVLLNELSEILATYPAQAVQVYLHKIFPLPNNEKISNRLRDLASKTGIFYVKVFSNIQGFPIVEFYKRTNNNYLASLNDTLALEAEIMSSRDTNSQLYRRGNRLTDEYSEFGLKAPVVPPIGAQVEVHVTMVAHPDNIKIQLSKSLNALQRLVNELSRYCESYTGTPLTASSVKSGNVYAAKFYEADNKWYRVCVSEIISETACIIYFCDYGNYNVVPISQLRPLKNPFYDLPCQAIKATLYGVTPKLKGDWTANDSYRLNELIANRTLLAVVKSCEQESVSGEMILGLELIVVTKEKDIFIRKVLVSENRADELT